MSRKFRYLFKRQYNSCMFLPNAPSLEVETHAVERLKIINSKTPKDFTLFGVLTILVVS